MQLIPIYDLRDLQGLFDARWERIPLKENVWVVISKSEAELD